MRHQLSAVSVYAAHRESLIQHHTSIVYQILSGKIIGAIDDEVVRTDKV